MKTSIIIRAYNSEKTIERALESALNQEFPKSDSEVVMVDDGSTDHTREILKKFENEPNVTLVFQKNQGPLAAVDTGVKNSKGIYLILLDADDSLEKDFLRSAVPTLDNEPEIDFVYADYYEHEDGLVKIINTGDNLFNVISGGILYRKSSLEKAGYWRSDVPWPEYDLFLRTIDTWKGKHMQGVYYHYFRQPQSLSKIDPEWSRKNMEKLKELHPAHADLVDKIRVY